MGALEKWLKSLIGLKKIQSRHLENVGSSGKGRKWRLWRSNKGGHVAVSDSSSLGVDDVFSAAVAIVVRATTKDFMVVTQEWAAIRIQTMFRAFLARQAFRALKAIVRVQAIFRGRQVRKQAAVTLRRMQALVQAQTRVRASSVSAQSRDKPAIALEDEEKENPDSLVQEMMDDGAAKHEPTIEDDVSTQNQHLQQIPILSGSHNFCSVDLDSNNRVIIDTDDIHPNNVAYSENSKSVDIAVSQGDPLSSTGDVWPPVSMPDSYYWSTLNHEYAFAKDTRKDLLHRQSNDGSFFNPYADQEVQGQNEVLQHFYKGQWGLPFHHEQKQTRLDLQPASNASMEMGQFSGLFREHLHLSLPLGKMFTDGSWYTIPRQEHFSNANTNVQDWAINTNTTYMSAPLQSHLDGGELGRNWFSGEHRVRGGWSTLDTNAVGPTQTGYTRLERVLSSKSNTWRKKDPKKVDEFISETEQDDLYVERIRFQNMERSMERKQYGIDVSYRVAWLGVDKARGGLFGDFATSFDQLRWYLETAMRTNPGSVFELDVDESSGCFRRLFVAFHGCLYGFQFCRPLLFVDGTFLKGRYKGHLLVATSKDGNQGLFPLAFAIVDAENQDNWMWFLSQLLKAVGSGRRLTFVSDRQHGLLDALSVVFPNAHHAYCLNHLKRNLIDKLVGLRTNYKLCLMKILVKCAYAPTVASFQHYMEKLRRIAGNGRVDSMLDGLQNDKWANAFFRGKRYGEMSSNAAESYNNWIGGARELPITCMVDMIRVQIMTQLSDRRAESRRWTTKLCPVMEKKLVDSLELAKSWDVIVASDTVLEVHSSISFYVDIGRQTCSCHEWQLNGFPCCHAVHALHCFRESYKESVYPVPSSERFDFDGASSSVIKPPITKKQPGRNKKKRIPSRGENVKQIKCGRCLKYGNHNKKTCKAAI
ncbi:unnamed protein product [Camellia sinensis]